MTNRRWFIVADGIRSRTLLQRVRPIMRLSASGPTAQSGQTVTFTGTTSPSHRGERVSLQQLEGNQWVTIARPRLGRGSQFTSPQTFSMVGTVQLRFAFSGDRKNAGGISAPVSVTITPNTNGIHKIRHVVIIMQENRSFDNYFGTYPGADGFPGGNPSAVCNPDPAHGGQICASHDVNDINYGGPHDQSNALADINKGKMDGFVAQSEYGQNCNVGSDNPNCSPCRTTLAKCDVMSYHDGREIPNYWTYAKDFVLQDHMFEPVMSYSLPSHLYMVSEWSAFCNPPGSASCINAPDKPNRVQTYQPGDTTPLYGWTDLTYLLHKYGVSWNYYVFQGPEPDCVSNQAITCKLGQQSQKTPSIWNPLPHFSDVHQDGQVGNVQSLSSFFTAAKAGTLPAVSWIDPNGNVSEHPPAPVSKGQTYVTGLINSIMQSPDWNSTAIFLSWDDWGGFYDGVNPPAADQNGYGLRVPGLVISPYAQQGYIDHQVLSHDAYVKFIEDDFLNGQRLDPATDGRPDGRPSVRENSPLLGNLAADFNFNQAPRPPVILPLCPQTDLVPAPPKC